MVEDTRRKDFYSYRRGSSQATKKLHRFQAGMWIIEFNSFLLNLDLIFLLFCLVFICPQLNRFHSQMHSHYGYKIFQTILTSGIS